MTNEQLILEYLDENEIYFNYDGNNLKTFQQWKREGLSVIKGQKATFTIGLWTMKLEDEKDSEGKIVKGEDGKPKKVKKFYKKASALFTAEQVEPVKAKAKKTKKKVA